MLRLGASYRNETVKRLANTRGTLVLINFNNRQCEVSHEPERIVSHEPETGFCLLDFFSDAEVSVFGLLQQVFRMSLRAFFSGQTPAKNEILRRRSSLHRVYVQIQVRICLTQIRRIKSQRIDCGTRGGGFWLWCMCCDGHSDESAKE